MGWLLAGVLGFVAPPIEEPRPHPAAYALRWDGPPECPDEAAVRARIAALGAGATGGDGRIEVEGSVVLAGSGYRLTLRTRYAEAVEVRELRDASCQALADSTALVVAMSLDPELEGPTQDAPVVPQPPSTAPRSEPRPRSRPPVSTPVARPRSASSRPAAPIEPGDTTRGRPPAGWSMSVAPLVEWGALPGVSGGLRLSVGTRWERMSLEAMGHWVGPRATRAEAGARGVAQQGAGGVRGCVRPAVGEVVFPVCVQFEAGVVDVRSRGLDPPNRLAFWWLAPAAGGGLERRWGWWGLFAAAELAVPIRRPRALVGPSRVFESRAVSARGLVGLVFFFATDSS